MIPKIIHQTAKTADISESCRKYQKIVQDLHPGWDYRFWTDVDNATFVKTEYPAFFPIFTALPKNIMRADVIRYLLMDRIGGLYLDLDYEMLKPFDLLDYEAVVPWESSGEWGQGNDILGNAFFASTPGQPFFRRVIDELTLKPPLGPDADVLTSTGPAFITRVYREMGPEAARIYAPAREIYNPVTPRNEKQYQAILKEGKARGIHHCQGSWREYTLLQKVRNAISRFAHRFI